MLELTPAARDKLTEYFEDKKVAPIRIYLAEAG
jgi:hypothetical protein